MSTEQTANTPPGRPDFRAMSRQAEAVRGQFGAALPQQLAGGGAVLGSLKTLGASAFKGFTHAEHAVTGFAAKQLAKLPAPIRTPLSLATRTAFASYTAGQSLAESVTRDIGHTPERAALIRKALAYGDVAGAKAVPAALAAFGMPRLALPASFVPAASTAYLARHPVATAKVLSKGLVDRLAGDMPFAEGGPVPQVTPYQQWLGAAPARKVYHGTRAEFSAFDPQCTSDNSAYGPGFYMSESPQHAREWAGGNVLRAAQEVQTGPERVMDLHLRAANPYDANWSLKHLFARKGLAKLPYGMLSDILGGNRKANEYLQAQGHDAITYTSGTVRNWVAFQPTQLKSASANRGTFDPADPDIYHARGGPIDWDARPPIRKAPPSASGFRSRGTDTVPAVVPPGSFVLNRASAEANKALVARLPHDTVPDRPGQVFRPKDDGERGDVRAALTPRELVFPPRVAKKFGPLLESLNEAKGPAKARDFPGFAEGGQVSGLDSDRNDGPTEMLRAVQDATAGLQQSKTSTDSASTTNSGESGTRLLEEMQQTLQDILAELRSQGDRSKTQHGSAGKDWGRQRHERRA